MAQQDFTEALRYKATTITNSEQREAINNYESMLSKIGLEITENILNPEQKEDFKIQNYRGAVEGSELAYKYNEATQIATEALDSILINFDEGLVEIYNNLDSFRTENQLRSSLE